MRRSTGGRRERERRALSGGWVEASRGLKLVCLPRVSPSVSPDTCPSCIGSPLKTAPLTYSLRPRRAVPSVCHPSPSAFPSSSQLEACPLSSQISYAKLDSFQISYAKLDLGRNDLKLIAVHQTDITPWWIQDIWQQLVDAVQHEGVPKNELKGGGTKAFPCG
ncbi:hypothetical protein PVAP13_2NG590900 [Panicum virgatum]|uniref:Uncharacterized protein n=1 Tax=Panicum virgatum TaxID=38727 RepID=A0A8T0VXJ5_PANVG|nr:hypothetical protein PVAP13_2NG590900 [Panicum virgatum]